MFRERCIEGNLIEVDEMRSGIGKANKASLTTVTVNTGMSGCWLKQREARFGTKKKKEKKRVVLHAMHKHVADVQVT